MGVEKVLDGWTYWKSPEGPSRTQGYRTLILIDNSMTRISDVIWAEKWHLRGFMNTLTMEGASEEDKAILTDTLDEVDTLLSGFRAVKENVSKALAALDKMNGIGDKS